jgi:hypothetical protein
MHEGWHRDTYGALLKKLVKCQQLPGSQEREDLLDLLHERLDYHWSRMTDEEQESFE